MNKEIHWYGFHTDHDFSYLLRMFTGQTLPPIENQFFSDLSLIFPNLYDIKVIAEQIFNDRMTSLFRISLSSLSDRLQVYRDDDCEHQAGSDSKITAKCFFELKKFGETYLEQYKGEIFGIGKNDSSLSNDPYMGGSRYVTNGKHLLNQQDNKQQLQKKDQGPTYLGGNDAYEYDNQFDAEDEYEDEQNIDFALNIQDEDVNP